MMECGNRLADILRFDRVNVIGRDEQGTVGYVDDEIALVLLDGGSVVSDRIHR
jgi:hypothetical protein